MFACVQVRHITLEVEQPASGDALAPLLSGLPLELRAKMETFIQACYEARQISFLPCRRPMHQRATSDTWHLPLAQQATSETCQFAPLPLHGTDGIGP